MAQRRPIVAGNWKMHCVVAEAVELARDVRDRADGDAVEIVLCPPFTALAPVAEALRGGSVLLGAQNVHAAASGAFTGEVSAAMLSDLGCRYVIVGHSERRQLFGETHDGVNRKARALLDAGLRPIVCVGETLDEREAGDTRRVVRGQLETSLAGLDEALRETVVAYEPVWAIGTGRTASAEQAQEVHAWIRGWLAQLAGAEIAAGMRIQYGGSVKPSNAGELFGCADVDGGLIGGASLDAGSFAAILRAAVA